jgi:hypothetical protein
MGAKKLMRLKNGVQGVRSTTLGNDQAWRGLFSRRMAMLESLFPGRYTRNKEKAGSGAGGES